MGFDPLSITAEIAIANALVDVGIGLESAYLAASAIAVATPYLATAAVIGGSIALSAAMQPTTKPAKAPKQAQAIDGGPRVYVIGKDLRPAQLMFSRSNGKFDLYRVGYICMGPIDGVEEYRISGRRIAVSGGTCQTEPFRSNIFIALKTGVTPQTVFSSTNSAFASYWLSTARGDGEALIEWRAKSPGYDAPAHSEIFASGYPTCDVIVRGRAPFDPRLGSDPTNDSFRLWTDNSAVQILDFLTRSRLLGGWQMNVAKWDLDDIIDVAIPWCDAIVPTKTGTEFQSRLWGSQNCGPDVTLADTLKALLLSSGLDILRTKRGKYTLRPVLDAPNPTAVIPWRQMLPGAVIDGGPVTFERPNRFVVKYLEQNRDFDTIEADMTGVSWATVQSEIDRTGDRPSSIDLEFCPSVGQASRIARRVAAMRRSGKATYVFGMGGLRANGHGEISVEDEDLGVSVPLLINSVSNDFSARSVTVDGVVKPTLAAFVPASDEASMPAIRDDVPDSQAPNSPTIQDAVVVADGYGGTKQWAVRVRLAWSGGTFLSDNLQTLYRTSTDNGRSWTGWVQFAAISSGLASPQTIQDGAFSSPPLVQIAAAQTDDSHNISEWAEETISYPSLTNQIPAPSVGAVDAGSGNCTVTVTADINTWYIEVIKTITVMFPSPSTTVTSIYVGDIGTNAVYTTTTAFTTGQTTITAYAFDSEGRRSVAGTASI